jgi:hypothetical protein
MRKWVSTIAVCIAVTGLFVSLSLAAAKDEGFPTRENPLVVDAKGKRVLIYTEVSEKNLHETNPHWGVVFKDGKYGEKAILRAFVQTLAFHDALQQIGARPGNNLTKDVIGKAVEGDVLDVVATWPGTGKELRLEDIFYDKAGKGFEVRFGGNRKASEEMNTGCITCLESCWIAITSNARYATISGATRAISPNSLFKGKAEALPGPDKPVILAYRLAAKK